jgi:hypothetical protein
MEQRKEITLDGVQYFMTPANAYAAWQNLQLLLGAIGRSKMDHPGDGSISQVIGLAFSVMDKPELAAVQRMVFEYTVVKPESGAPAKLVDCGETHFNQYRAHLPILLVEGAQYQFGDFFTGIQNKSGFYMCFMFLLSLTKTCRKIGHCLFIHFASVFCVFCH